MSGKAKKSIKQGLGVLGQRIASPFRSRSRSPSQSSRSAASATINDLPVGRAAPVSSHRNSQAGVVGYEPLVLESGEASNTRPRSAPPLQTAIPAIVINNSQIVESGETPGVTETPGPLQSPNQVWVSPSSLICLGTKIDLANASMYLTSREPKSGLELAFDDLSDPQKAVLQGYGLGNDTDGDPSERFKQQLQKIRKLGDQCSNEPKEVGNGKPFLTRGRVYNILRKIEKFAKIGDIAIQHHPDVVALVWASLRMLLQVCYSIYVLLLRVARYRRSPTHSIGLPYLIPSGLSE